MLLELLNCILFIKKKKESEGILFDGRKLLKVCVVEKVEELLFLLKKKYNEKILSCWFYCKREKP